jgi:hypothetical protein
MTEAIPTGNAPIHIVEQAYALWAEPESAIVTLATPRGRVYTNLPLTARSGRTSLPPGFRARTQVSDGNLLVRLTDAGGALLQQAILRPSSASFTVAFSARVSATEAGGVAFFHDGVRGLDMATIDAGFTPDPREPGDTRTPVVSTVGWRPFAPPPLDIEVHAAPGWIGIGLAEIPDATTMGLGRDGAVSIDYPLQLAGSQADLGAGPPEDGMVRFPSFVVTFTPDAQSGLHAYHDALDRLGMATVASPPGARPVWWSEPLVDTWGEQMAVHAERDSPRFTSAWVRQFVDTWRQRYHLPRFTVVIDSRWQASLGEPVPDGPRFGGTEGMRKLIDSLHAEGMRVLLWWPLWIHGAARPPADALRPPTPTPPPIVDPTAPDFATGIARSVETLLGSAPDELNADGLKLDWTYTIPPPERLSRPEVASGALALHRYLEGLYAAAHAVRADALIDGGAATPQFSGVEDAVRLYDAWSEADWDRRAAIVTAADPGLLIDGDGWQATSGDVLPHAISSTVYGTPAMYFDTTWADGGAIPASLAEELGTVLSLAITKDRGLAESLAGGDWQYVVGGVVTARSYSMERGIVVRPRSCGSSWQATAVSAVTQQVIVPITGGRLLSVVDAAGHRAAAMPAARGVLMNMAAGVVYTLSFAGGC